MQGSTESNDAEQPRHSSIQNRTIAYDSVIHYDDLSLANSRENVLHRYAQVNKEQNCRRFRSLSLDSHCSEVKKNNSFS